MRDGYAPLFINKRLRMKPGIAYQAENHPTKGFAERFGWHCTFEPKAPHLKEDIDNRIWVMVELEGETIEYDRPESQGGKWVLCTGTMTIIGEHDPEFDIQITDAYNNTETSKSFTLLGWS